MIGFLFKLILLIGLGVFGVAAYQVAVEQGYFDAANRGSGPRYEAYDPTKHRPTSGGQPVVGTGPVNVGPRADCQNLGSYEREMRNAYSTYLSNKTKWNYENYMFYKQRYNNAIMKCR